MNASAYHQPVMTSEVDQYLIGDPSGVYVDCTLGGGGHSRYLLEKYPLINIIALDVDEASLKEVETSLSDYRSRIQIFRENFKNLINVLQQIPVPRVHGIFADLGVSSKQFDDMPRGFSFQSPSIDMRMDNRLGASAENLVNTLDAEELADLFYKLGEETFSRPISRRIVQQREKQRITSGKMLADIVASVKRRHGRIHPATKVFQALRIAVNSELESLSAILSDAPALLNEGGKIVILSYHSLEDRIIKNDFRNKAREGIYKLLTKKVVIPSFDEVRQNPRARSAKLRAAEKLGLVENSVM